MGLIAYLHSSPYQAYPKQLLWTIVKSCIWQAGWLQKQLSRTFCYKAENMGLNYKLKKCALWIPEHQMNQVNTDLTWTAVCSMWFEVFLYTPGISSSFCTNSISPWNSGKFSRNKSMSKSSYLCTLVTTRGFDVKKVENISLHIKQKPAKLWGSNNIYVLDRDFSFADTFHQLWLRPKGILL